MQLKEIYNIATKVSSKKSATTFGDLPDWIVIPADSFSSGFYSDGEYNVGI